MPRFCLTVVSRSDWMELDICRRHAAADHRVQRSNVGLGCRSPSSSAAHMATTTQVSRERGQKHPRFQRGFLPRQVVLGPIPIANCSRTLTSTAGGATIGALLAGVLLQHSWAAVLIAAVRNHSHVPLSGCYDHPFPRHDATHACPALEPAHCTHGDGDSVLQAEWEMQKR